MRKETRRPCPTCGGCRWVCENHPDRPAEGPNACDCGAGMPCPACNGDNTVPQLPPSFVVEQSAAPSVQPPTDLELVLRAIEDARLILGGYIAPGRRDAVRTINTLLAVLDRQSLVRAIERLRKKRGLRLVDDIAYVDPENGNTKTDR